MGSRVGLNPKIRGNKGIGFRRSLPAPFGFDNGFLSSGSNSFLVPAMAGGVLPDEITYEAFSSVNSSSSGFAMVSPFFNDNSFSGLWFSGGGGSNLIWINPGQGNSNIGMLSPGVIHTVISTSLISNRFKLDINGGQPNGFFTTSQSLAAGNFPTTSKTVSNFYIASIGPYFFPDRLIDEVRVYNKILSDDEIIFNYNSGAGNNPAITENLIMWFKFQQFEMLDFSTLQNGSDIRLGIRDFSGRNNHAVPNGTMDTNPSSPTYVLKPFP